jgi:hypothetical protein
MMMGQGEQFDPLFVPNLPAFSPLLDTARRTALDSQDFGINDRNAARENARRQALAAVNDLVRAYGMLDVKLNRTLLDNIMILGLRHAIEPLDAESQPVQWELP